MRFLDLPPLWLALAVGLLWIETRVTGGLPVTALFTGAALIFTGFLLTAFAIAGFLRAGTSPIPHTEPAKILTTGVFGMSRNPIYLGDVLILIGAALALGAASGLVIVPAFVALIDRRFIRAEEARLAARFPAEWAAYSASVRRWI